jgi:hypothetical protein
MERRTLLHAHENPLKRELIPALKKSIDTRDIVERSGEAVSVAVPYARNAAHRGAIFSAPEYAGDKPEPLVYDLALQRVQKRHQVRFLQLRQPNVEPRVVEVNGVLERRGRTVVEIRGPGREAAEDRAFELGDVAP